MEYHRTWPKAARDEFERAVEAHGGWHSWETFAGVDLEIREFRGLLPFLKGSGKTFHAPRKMSVDPKSRRVEFDYGSYRNIFQDGELTFSPDASFVANGRSLFTRSLFEQWYPQHALYFFGYAFANYIGYPFILPPFELIAWNKGREKTSFKIRFPDSFHTHSTVQNFYFGPNRLLSRHDYHADCAGAIFYGAHFTEGYELYGGIQIARLRKVRPGHGLFVAPLYGIYARLDIAPRP